MPRHEGAVRGSGFARVCVRAWCVGVLAVAGVMAGLAGSAVPVRANSFPLVINQPVAGASGNYLAALVAGQNRDIVAAASFLKAVLAYDPRNIELAQRTLVFTLASGQMQDAWILARALDEAKSRSIVVTSVLATRAARDGRWRESARLFRQERNTPILALLEAWALAGAGDTAGALVVLGRITEPAFALRRDYYSGLILDMAGRREAGRLLQAAFDRSGNKIVPVSVAWARWLARQGEADQAKTVLEGMDFRLLRHPLLVQARTDLAAGAWRKSGPVITDARAGLADVLYYLGTSGAFDPDDPGAILNLQLAHDLAPDDGMITLALAEAWQAMRRHGEALAVLSTIPETSSLALTGKIQSALVLDAMGRAPEAVALMQGVVKARPDDVGALSTLASLLRARKDWSQAITHYDTILSRLAAITEKDPQVWQLYYERGICYERSNQWPLAEADFRKALALSPDQPGVLNYLGYSWAERKENLDEALDMLRRAVAGRPGDGYILDSFGWIHYRLGHYREARLFIEQAVDLIPSDPTVNEHLGDIYWQTGRQREAVFQWNHARDQNPEPEDLARILRKIERGPEDGQASAPGLAPALLAPAAAAAAVAPALAPAPGHGG